jgi:mannosyltransferase
MDEISLSGAHTARDSIVVMVPAVVALLLGVLRSMSMPLWRDEFATRLYASLSVSNLFRATAHVDAVLTPYYLLVHAVQSVTGLGRGMRLPSIVAAAVAVAGVTLLARWWYGTVAAILAGIALAVNNVLIAQAANARPYALATMFAVVAVIGLGITRRGRPAAGYATFAICASAAVALQPFAAAFLVATLALAVGRGWRTVVSWIAVSVPWVIVVVMQLWAGRDQSAQLAWVGAPRIDTALSMIATLAGTPGGVSLPMAAIVVVGLIGVGVVALVRLRRVRAEISFALLATFLPTAVLYAVSVGVHPVLTLRYVTWSSVGAALLVGAGGCLLVWTWRTGTMLAFSAGAIAIAALVLTPLIVMVGAVADAPTRKDDLPAAVARIEQTARVGDLVVVVQRYEQGGVALGFALASGDLSYADAITRDASKGTRTVLEIRRIAALHPLRTVPWNSNTVGDGRRTLWVVSILAPTLEDPTPLPPDVAECYVRAAAAPRIPVTGTYLSRAPCPGA